MESPSPEGTVARHAADLVFTQDALGHYLSFYWQSNQLPDLHPDHLVFTQMGPTSGPVNIEHYFGKVRWVLDHLKPIQFEEVFCYGNQQIAFEITLSPILLPQQTARTLLVLGKSISPQPWATSPIDAIVTRKAPITEVGLARYQKFFTLIAWNIRRTLDLETIWQQTVNGLGSILKVDRCLICAYTTDSRYLPIVAEYQRVPAQALRGELFDLQAHPQLQETFTSLTPTTTIVPLPQEGTECALMAIATSYQDQPNGLIVMGYGSLSVDPFKSSAMGQAEGNETTALAWSKAELESVSELADQVGTALAHAHLFGEVQELAQELQDANSNLVQKHWELEEARQQAEEISRIKSEFLANTSHELRTPLNGMIGFLKLVMDDMADSPEEEHEFVTEAHRSALLLLDIINDILDIAKIEAGRMELDLEPVNLDELFADVERKTRTHTERKDLIYELHRPNTRDEVLIYGDYQRLLQIMLNLVGNAIKFTHEGGITVSAQIKRSKVIVQDQEMPGYVQVSVADTGIGVSLEKQSRLFKAFSQVDSSRTRQYGGTGLGLVISQRLVEAMGGQVNFYSMGDGLGSTVTFTAPLYQEPVILAFDD
ncbi:sensor histidine kinase [Prochlorothrix hollandica]|uniref:sensor histidine kinase n=1 Tax=Prochlorothrix hollandica TaxID=1223 RepID=UPI00334173B7